MKILFVYDEIPNKDHSTDSYCAYLLLKMLRDRGHDVELFMISGSNGRLGTHQIRKKWIKEVQEIGCLISELDESLTQMIQADSRLMLKNQILGLFSSHPEYFFSHQVLATHIEKIFVSSQSDKIFVWGCWPAVAAVSNILGASKLAFLGDPPHEVARCRIGYPFLSLLKRWSPIQLLRKIYLRQYAKATARLLGPFEIIAATSALHAKWYAKSTRKECGYLPNMIPDWGADNWILAREKARKGITTFKIIHIGQFGTTANYSSIVFIAEQLLPALLKLTQNFEFHLCGKGELSPKLKKLFSVPQVRMRGFVDDIEEEVRSSDAFLVTTPIRLGIRVRIPYAWGSGCPVVAHQANCIGLPEMRAGENALIGNNAQELASEIMRLMGDKDLSHKLSQAGRDVYDTIYACPQPETKIANYFGF